MAETASATSPLGPLSGVVPDERPEFLLRASVVVLVAFTAAVALLPGIHGHAVAPAVDLALDTTAAVVAISLTVLAWVRYGEGREAIAPYLASAFLSLATAYAVAVAMSLERDAALETLAVPNSEQAWVFAVARILAAALLVVGGTGARRGRQPRRPGLLLVLPGAAVLAIALVAYAGAGISERIPLLVSDAPPDSLPMATAAGVAVQMLTAILFFVAAWVMRAMWRRERIVMDAWIAIALVFAGFAELHWAMYPSGHPGQVATADLLRLACFLALLMGIEAEARATLARLRTANVELQALRELEVQRAAIAERSRLARELHDGLAQDLWLAKLKTGQMASVPGMPAEAQPLLRDAEAAIDSGLTEARQAVLALRLSTGGEEGFGELMHRYVDDFEDRFGLRVEFACDGDSSMVPPRTQAEVLRIAQEALTNVRHHARATIVGVRLEITRGEVTLRVVDNGRGFDPHDTKAGSFGLLSMRERAALIGGTLEVRSLPGDGTTILLTAPTALAPSPRTGRLA